MASATIVAGTVASPETQSQQVGSGPMSTILDDRLRRLVAQANAGAFIPPSDPTGATKMAREFKMPKGAKLAKTAATGETKYPWDEWFSGKLLLIERSEGAENDKGTIEVPTTVRDYGVPRDAMGPKIKTAARRRYKVVDVYRRDHNGAKLENEGLLIQARDMTDEERVTEDILRAEEKEKAKQKKEEKNGTTATDDTAPAPDALV